MTISLKIDNKLLKAKLADLSKVEAAVAPKIYDYFKSVTPIRTGNARANTYLHNNEIVANYPYAERLDNGYSQQAPNGMTTPTEAYAVKVTTDWIKQHGAKK